MENNESGKVRLAEDFKKVVTDMEALLRSVAGVAGEESAAIRASLAKNLETAKAELRNLQQAVQDLYILSSPQSPMRDLLAGITRQLTLTQPPPPPRGRRGPPDARACR